MAKSLHARAQDLLPGVPHILLVNKSDIEEHREIQRRDLDELAADGWEIIETSAKTSAGVEEAFARLTARMLESQ